VGIVLLVLAIILFGDMSNVLASGGRKVTAFSVHGVTCAVMLVAGLLLIHAFLSMRRTSLAGSPNDRSRKREFYADWLTYRTYITSDEPKALFRMY
jgi:hypothetical protein